MNTQNQETYEDYDEIFEAERQRSDRQAHRRARMRPNYKPKRDAAEVIRSIAADDDSLQTGFETSYRASKHEKIWIGEALGSFYTQGEITDVLRMVKGGKEACVYQCDTGGGMGREFVAAKIYRPRRFRNLRNDAQYRQGRRHLDADGKEMRDDRALRAIEKGTERGRALAHTSWLAHELDCLQRLYELGADVPEPLASGNNVILMDYIGDAEQPAPTLNHVSIEPDEAKRLLARVLSNVEIMLEAGIVHGDLSAYNILYHDGRITLIDFPQVVNPARNPAAWKIFQRDMLRICQYFGRMGASVDAAELAETLWSRYVDDPFRDPDRVPSELSMLSYRAEQSELDAGEDEDD